MGHFRLDNEFVNGGLLSVLSNAALKVFLSLNMRKNNGSRKCFPSLTRLQKDSGLGRKAVVNGLMELKEIRLVEIVEQKKGKTNTYKIISIPEWYHKETSIIKKLVSKRNQTSIFRKLPLVSLRYPEQYEGEQYEKNKTKGEENGNKRKNIRGENKVSVHHASGVEQHTEEHSTGIRSTNQKLKQKANGAGEREFEEKFLQPYPKRPRGNGKIALSRYKKIPKKNLPDFWRAVKNYFALCEEKENQYIINADGFMNPGYWSQYANEEDCKPNVTNKKHWDNDLNKWVEL